LPIYKQECAACHIAYPAGMLPAGSWKRLMSGLNKHYGTDASLDAKSLSKISGWLDGHAGTYKRVSEMPPDDRITKSAWFIRKHNEREVSPAVWKRASVGSASNCIACHTNAAQGSYSEREIRIPK
jgi:mono/diheme cytochrome c family protein